MKYEVYRELPRRPGRFSPLGKTYQGAIDAACEHEPHWIRVDELAHPKTATCSTRAAALKRHAEAYAERTGLTGFVVKQRRLDGKSYPFIRKAEREA